MYHYYTPDGRIFDSKIQALAHATSNGHQARFYYHDDVYSKLDWTTEPTESLDQLYLEQAQQLRDTYDRVILCYSGGYDSQNILETFYYNNLALDKIVIVGAFGQDSHSGVDENHNGELYHNAFPYLNELGLDSIVQICDYAKMFDRIENFSLSVHGENWVDSMGGWFSPHNWFWHDLEQHVIPPQWENQRVAIIFGRDKPILYSSTNPSLQVARSIGGQINGFFFSDTRICSYGNIASRGNSQRINFYWDPAAPKILIKQLHVLYRAYQAVNDLQLDTAMGVQKFKDQTVNQLVYNLRRPLLFKSPKSSSSVISLRDKFLLGKTDSDVYRFHQLGMERIDQLTNARNRMPAVYSRFYSIIKHV